MLQILLYGLLIWFLYNLIFRFIIPIYKTTRQMKQKFREMQSRMRDQMNDQQHGFNTQAQSAQKSTTRSTKEDYIDFEEVK